MTHPLTARYLDGARRFKAGVCVVVAGGRYFSDEAQIRADLARYPAGTVLYHGACPYGGADGIADRIGRERGFIVEPRPMLESDDPGNPRARGPKRSLRMCTEVDGRFMAGEFAAVHFYQYPTPGAENRGTEHCARFAGALGFTAMNPAHPPVNQETSTMIGKFAQTAPAPAPAAPPQYPAAVAPPQAFGALPQYAPPAAAPAPYYPPPAAAPAGPPASRWAGIQSAQPRDPLPNAGAYRFRLAGMVYGFNPGTQTESSKVTLEVVGSDGPEANKPGETVTVVNLLTGKAGLQGMPRTKAIVMAFAGCESDAEYNAFDPDGAFIDACHGRQNHRTAEAARMIGRLADSRVMRGNDVKDEHGNQTGDYYRNCQWFVVPEAQQPGGQ